MGKRSLAIAATLVLVLSMGFSVIVAGAAVAVPSAKAPASASPASAATTANTPYAWNLPASKTPGNLSVYNVIPNGATTEDPAVAYDTVSFEPILNVYEPLITYNGSSSTSYIPVLATCVPGTAQCMHDYGSTLIKGNNWTFVIDPTAKFYDPTHTASWGVYPTDVMFTIARDMGYAQSLGPGNTADWLIAQALLPNGVSSFDGGIHSPYNNTPGHILSSMLINDSTFCPAAAMTAAHGCITFNVDGGGTTWPFFAQLIDDGFFGIVSCGWYTANGAGLPGWAGTNATNGDGSCELPGGGNTTNTTNWATYVSGLAANSWDTFENNLNFGDYPVPTGAGAVQWNLVGSGPYYAITDPTGSPPGYSLFANPAYAQPVGCTGAGGLAKYTGYCDPAAHGYNPNVAVYYEPSDTAGINALTNGDADLAAILPTDTSTLLSLKEEGKVNYFSYPSLSIFFMPFNLNWSQTSYTNDHLSGSPNIPNDFLSGVAVRQLMEHAFPYSTVSSTAFQYSGVHYFFIGNGPIVSGLNYYPTNISYPAGNPVTNASIVGSAGWWWHVGTTVHSGYYDPELANCMNTSCVFPIVGQDADPVLDAEISDLMSELVSISGGALQPFTYDLPFGGSGSLIADQVNVGPGTGPLPVWNLGWAPDNFDPSDYLIPLASPNSTYTFSDAEWQQLNLPAFDNVGVCGHAVYNMSNLIFWAKAGELNSSCQGVAYNVMNSFLFSNTHQENSSLRGLTYWAIQSIFTELGLDIWAGQSYTIPEYAPWIDPNSINTNFAVGGGGDQYYFQIKYIPAETPVTFNAIGLPGSTTFGMSAGTPSVANNSNGTSSITYFAPAGSLPFTFTPPAGYAVTKVTGGKQPTTSGLTVVNTRHPLAVKVFFVQTSNLTFNETGLLAGAHWSVSLTWNSHKGAPNGNGTTTYTQSSSGTSIVFSHIPEGSWKFTVGYNTLLYKAGPKQGAVGVHLTDVSKLIKFHPIVAKITWKETGLTRGTNWTITITGTENLTTYGTHGALVLKLIDGSYSWTATATGFPTKNGVLTISNAPRAGTPISVTF